MLEEFPMAWGLFLSSQRPKIPIWWPPPSRNSSILSENSALITTSSTGAKRSLFPLKDWERESYEEQEKSGKEILTAFFFSFSKRNQLRQNYVLNQYFLDIDMKHIIAYDEELANQITTRPTEFIALVSGDQNPSYFFLFLLSSLFQSFPPLLLFFLSSSFLPSSKRLLESLPLSFRCSRRTWMPPFPAFRSSFAPMKTPPQSAASM